MRWRDPLLRTCYSTLASFMLNADGKPSRLDMRLGRDQLEARRK